MISLEFDFQVQGEQPPQEPTRNLYKVKRDQFMYSWDFQIRDVVRNGNLPNAPAVNRTGEIGDPANFVRSKFTKELQFLFADILAMDRYGKLFNDLATSSFVFMNKPSFASRNRVVDGVVTFAMMVWAKVKDLFIETERNHIIRVFKSLTLHGKYLTNFAGTDTHNNYITGEMRGEDPKIDPLICADSIVEVMEVRVSNTGKTFGLVMARLNTFSASESPPVVTRSMVESDPRILRATVIYPDGQLIPFPNFDGDPVPYPYIARHDCWFPLRDLEKV